MLKFFGTILDAFNKLGGNYLWGLFIYAVFSKVLSIIGSKDYHKSISLTGLIKPQIEAIRKKHKNNKKISDKEITELMVHMKYAPYGYATLFLSEGIMVLIIGLILRDVLMYTSASSISEFTVNNIDLTLSPIKALFGPEFTVTSSVAVMTLFGVMALQIKHDSRMESVRLIEQEPADHVIWVLVAVLCALLPVGAGMVMLCYKAVDMGLLYYYERKARKAVVAKK